MNANNKNNSSSKSKKIHNPRANLPAVYIPCWLIQVPVKQLSHAAKLLYGRLIKWCDESGTCYRSTPQLAAEMGMCETSVKNVLRELRQAELIGTFHPQAGGVNHFEFYDHPWMHEAINENLSYKNDPPDDPRRDHAIPQARSCPTPRHDHARINIKEIKTNKDNIGTNDSVIETEQKKTKESFGLNELMEDNPHEIKQEVLQDWLKVRKSKRAPITKTTWTRLNATLSSIEKETLITAHEAFETMVANGWQSLELKYFTNQPKTNGKKINNDDTTWGKDFYLNNELGF